MFLISKQLIIFLFKGCLNHKIPTRLSVDQILALLENPINPQPKPIIQSKPNKKEVLPIKEEEEKKNPEPKPIKPAKQQTKELKIEIVHHFIVYFLIFSGKRSIALMKWILCSKKRTLSV